MKKAYTLTAIASAAALLAGSASAGTTNVGLSWNNDFLVGTKSLNDGKPALQGYAEHWFDNGFFVGAWFSQVDWGTADKYEIDTYLGYFKAFGPTTVNLGLVAFNYDDYGHDYVQAWVDFDHYFTEDFALGTKIKYAFDNNYNYDWRYVLTSDYKASDKTSFAAEYQIDPSNDTHEWKVSAAYAMTDQFSAKITYAVSDFASDKVGFSLNWATSFGG
ncbi:TorF family putative porin [Celeribacter naphthalenivorans]|uniref:TorF family putative porin n=1 Tax=Celeribacter naphthalenivorans TaxID=1614694 RepID=UPI001CFB95D2|nr:TorF family putative porin [Celeribacter naphthalenivorans]